MRCLGLLPTAKRLVDRNQLNLGEASEIVLGGGFGLERAEVVLGDDRLRLRRIEEVEISLGHLARAFRIDVAVDERHRRLRKDRQRRRNDFELVLAELVERQKGVVFPSDQDVAEAALGEGDRRSASARVEDRHILVDCSDEVARFGLVAVELALRP